MKNRLWNRAGALGVILAGTCMLLNACTGLVTASRGGGTPAASMSPASLTFASQTVNTASAAQSVTLTNSGSAALSLTSITITGTNSGDFAQTNTCGSSVNANGSCSISVTFTPAAAGTRTANLSFTDNATGSPQTVSLTGTGAAANAPAVTLSPASLTFASQTVNTASAAQSVTLTNSGSAALSLTSIALTGTNSGDFAQTNTCGSSVNASASCSISVTFTPTVAGTRTGAISITDNATGSPQTVSLTGTGAAAGTPSPALSPSSLTFGSQTVGSSSAAQTVQLSNAGTATLSITSITITGTNSGDFTQTNTCGSSLAVALICDINVTFTPTAAGTRTATVTVTDNASGSPQTVSLTGTGASASTIANVTPTSVAFGNVTVNTTSAAQTVTVTNGGTTTFTVNSVTTSAPFAVSGFSPALPATLTASQSLTFQVTFAPTSAVAANGSVTIAYDAASGLANGTVSLSGTGVTASGGAAACGGGGALSVTTLALPQATASANYIAFLQASGGTGTCTWSISSGALPTGLTLDAGSGVIFGTGPATTGTSSSFTVQVKDSSGATASEALTLKTDATTNAVCDDVYIDNGSGANPAPTPVPVTIDGILNGSHVVPLDDLGTKGGTYNGQAGGLYPGGSNTRPSAYDSTGVGLAQQIQPLDSNGNPSASGKYVLVTIGMSNTNIESGQFVTDAAADSAVNHTQLVIVNGAENGMDVNKITATGTTYWSDVATKLSNAGVSPNQVVAAWVKEAMISQQGGAPNFPGDAQTLASKYEQVAQLLKTNYPNIKLAYFSSRIYAGYAGTAHLLNPEYVAYDSGFGVKFAVEDSINGKVANAPWYAWGPYMWANGMIPRSDGLVWTCQEFQGDGTHPSGTPPGGQAPPDSGAEKVSQMLLKFFKTDSTTKGWFCATGACP